MPGQRPFWEAEYADPAAETFGPASPEVVEVASALPEGSLVFLDIGCGDGRNAIYLADQGLRVDAFDVSTFGRREVSEAVARGLSVRAWVQDVGTFVFRREYDLVVAHGDEHLLDREVGQRDELRVCYDGWVVDRWETYTLNDEHPGGVRHAHPINKVVAQKPR